MAACQEIIMDTEWPTDREKLWMQTGNLPENIYGCRLADCQEISMNAEWQTVRKH